jgi:hypothetical protein
MEKELIPLSPEDRFRFSCSPAVSCFNACCRDLNQILTPYDIIRLKNHLGLESHVFLDRYTVSHVGPETGLPVIVLRQDPKNELKCPFVTEEGCAVYKDRPGSCRIYPLARGVFRSRETGRMTEQYVLLQESHCNGCDRGKEWTVQEWIHDQEIAIYNQMNDLLMEIISLKNKTHPHPLDFRERHLFHLVCYDVDAFRRQVFENHLLRDADTEQLAAVKTDDTALMKLGVEWLAKALFGTD